MSKIVYNTLIWQKELQAWGVKKQTTHTKLKKGWRQSMKCLYKKPVKIHATHDRFGQYNLLDFIPSHFSL